MIVYGLAGLVVGVKFLLVALALAVALVFANPLLLTSLPDTIEPSFRISDRDGRGKVWVLLK